MAEVTHAETAAAPPPSPPPPRGPRLIVIALFLLCAGGAMAAGVVWHAEIRGHVEHVRQTVEAWRAGPAATPAEGQTPAPEGAEHAANVQYFTCGMHPWVILPHPGDCPICHMKLVPLDPAKFTTEIVINPVMTQNIGVRITPVTTGPVTRVIRTVGAVDYNETMVRDVNLKVAGWVEKLYVNYVGQPVKQAQPLLEIYSPELYAAQEEYLLAIKRAKSAKGGPVPDMPDLARMDAELLESSRKRLENFDVPADEIAALEKSGKAAKTMTLRSPFEGLVVAKTVFEGNRVEAGTQLLRIADLSKVWIMVTIYEYQIPYVEVGQKAVMSLPYIPGMTFEGKVTYVYPYLNPELRQVKVRLEFDNPNLLLKPGMFANVELKRTLATDRTLIPREALIDTGARQVAFVSMGGGRYEPRTVKVGVEADGGMVEVLDGLAPGEMVVTSGEFLLDSESRLREALSKLVQGNLASEQKAATAVEGASELESLPAPAGKAIAGILDGYLAIAAKLAADTLEGVVEPARQVAENAGTLVKVEFPAAPGFWQKHAEVADVRGKALELIDAKKIEDARQKFADLSIAVSTLVHATGVPPMYGKTLEELHCPMFREGQGGTTWIQLPGEVRNPYYGKIMLGCFDRRVTLSVTGAKPAAGKAGAAKPTTRPAPPTPLPAAPAAHRH